MRTLLVIDAHALIHRAYHALPPLTDASGRVMNAVYGFSSVLIKILRDIAPNYVIAAFDLAEATFRHEAYKEYKATRAQIEDELAQQFPVVRQVLQAFNIPILEHPNFEADDIIGTVVEDLRSRQDIRIVIATGDRDTLQLVSGKRVVVDTLKGGPAAKMTDTVIYDEQAVTDRFGGLSPQQLTDFKGLVGDPSDNIPGVPKIGEKTAIELLKRHKNLEGIYEHVEKDEKLKPSVRKSLIENKDTAFFSRELATIRRDAPIGFSLEDTEFRPDKLAVSRLLEKLGFQSLVRRLSKESFVAGLPQTQSEGNTNGFDEYYRKGLFSKRIYNLERALEPVLRKMEHTGIKIDTARLAKLNNTLKDELAKLEKKIYQHAGEEFNIRSSAEIGRILFEKLELRAGRIKKTKTGQYSTAAGELEKYIGAHEVVPLILRWRELSKLCSTYLEAIPRMVGNDGRLHTTFKQLGAATGRLSSENPNVQNIPIRGEYGGEIRKAFIADSGFHILAADYTQIELRIAAALSGDSAMIETFRQNEDIHTRTAAAVFNVPVEKVGKDMRRQAKILNFGVLYGMGPSAFAASAGIDRERAAELIHEYQSDFVELTRFMQELKARAYAVGYAETVWGRRRPLPELSSPNPGIRSAGERMAINMPIQGTEADIIKAAMVEIEEATKDADDIRMILQVHDELLFEVKANSIERYAPRIKKIMEGVIKLAVPLDVKIESGPNWGELSLVQ